MHPEFGTTSTTYDVGVGSLNLQLSYHSITKIQFHYSKNYTIIVQYRLSYWLKGPTGQSNHMSYPHTYLGWLSNLSIYVYSSVENEKFYYCQILFWFSVTPYQS